MAERRYDEIEKIVSEGEYVRYAGIFSDGREVVEDFINCKSMKNLLGGFRHYDLNNEKDLENYFKDIDVPSEIRYKIRLDSLLGNWDDFQVLLTDKSFSAEFLVNIMDRFEKRMKDHGFGSGLDRNSRFENYVVLDGFYKSD